METSSEQKIGNELIAEFLGWERFENPFRDIKKEDGYFRQPTDNGTYTIVGELKFHTSWDWLMPVVEKIEKTEDQYDTRICFHADEGAYFCDIVDQENNEFAFQSSYTRTKIEVVYNAVLEFIKRSVKPIGLVQPMGCKRQSELALRKNVLANSIRRCLTDGTNKVTIRPEHILVPIVLTKCGRV